MGKKRIIYNWVIIEAAVLLLLILCSIAVITQVMTFTALPVSFIGAALGAVITGLMTAILLKGQAASQEEKERNVKIFELKKDAFTKYINRVWEIWEDHRVDDSEFEELCSNFYKNIAIYLDKETSEDFVSCMIEIGKRIGTETEENSRITKENIFKIINILVGNLKLGGKISQKQHEDLEKELFPAFLRKAIATEIYKVLKPEFNYIMEGKFEAIYYDEGTNEFLSFYFDTMKTIGYNDCVKFVIGPFKQKDKPAGQLWMDLYIEKDVESFPKKEGIAPIGKYRLGLQGWNHRFIRTKGNDDNHIIYKSIDKDDENQKEYIIDFGNTEELEKKYIGKHMEVAKVLAQRVGKFIKKERIIEKDIDGNDTKNELSYIDFLRKMGLID